MTATVHGSVKHWETHLVANSGQCSGTGLADHSVQPMARLLGWCWDQCLETVSAQGLARRLETGLDQLMAMLMAYC